LNALLPISVTSSGRTTVVREAQPAKAFLLTLVTPLTVTFFKVVTPLNAYSGRV
jgi:hypothetical protein